MLGFDLMDTRAGQEIYDEGLEKGIEKGMEQGIEKGIEQGIEKGMEQGIEKGIEQGIEKGMEQGIEKGIEQGIEKGMLGEAKEMVIDNLEEHFGIVPGEIIDKINAIARIERLKTLHKQAIKCQNIDEFQKMLEQSE